MAELNPTLKVTINDNLKIRNLSYEETAFTVQQAWEGRITLIVGDGYKSIPLSTIDVIKKIIIVAPTEKSCNLKIYIDDTVNPPIEQVIPFQNVFVYEPTAIHSGIITAIEISTSSVTDINIDVRILG